MRRTKPIEVLHIVSVDKKNYYLNNLSDHSDADEVRHSFVTFAAENCDFVQDMKMRGRRVFALQALSRKRYPTAYRRLGRLLAELDPHVVHTHLFDPSLIGLTVARLQKRKTVLTRHHSDAIHQIASPFKRRFYLGLERYISRSADHIIAPSKMVRRFLVDREGVANEKVSIIPYGQTTERFDAVMPDNVMAVRDELRMDGLLSLVCVSRLFHRKGHKYLFEAFAGLKREGLVANLYLVGGGDHFAELQKLAGYFEIADNVKFLGWRDDALDIMAAADIIVHPSLEDALSSAVIESIMLEKPIVATDISGARDTLGDGRYGRIVEPADPEALRNGIKEILIDLEAAKKKAAEGRKYLLNYMDARRVSLAYTDIYKRLLGIE